MQLDEKWAFVQRKRRSEADEQQWTGKIPPPRPSDVPPAVLGPPVGDCWDHVAFDPETRLVLTAVVGRHSVQSVYTLMQDLKRRLPEDCRPLFTSDAYGPYETVIPLIWRPPQLPPAAPPAKKQARQRRQKRKAARQAMNRAAAQTASAATMPLYARVNKQSAIVAGQAGVKGQVQVVLGTKAEVEAALAASTVSRVVNTSLLERAHATDRHRNARKARQSYRFSKDWDVHVAVSYFTLLSYNFCWCVRTLSLKGEDGRRRKRTPAMAAGLADHVWSLEEWLRRPVPGLSNSS